MYIITQGGGTVIYDNVKKLCDQKGISIWRLERDLGFSNRSVSKWNDNEPGIRKVQKVGEYPLRSCWSRKKRGERGG